MFTVYLLLSLKSGKTYVGMTAKDVNNRVKEHNQSSNRWTSKHTSFKLIYHEVFHCKKDAILREKFLKTGIGNRVVKAIIKEFS